ncbi:sugar phosphate isomerase/epimerase, partial [Klebsiella pneumoniae]|nr:sugar phosphate isomerase/epimerase [Klebsiella pneumoniae]
PLGVTIAIEPMHPTCGTDWTILNGLDDALSMIRECNSQRLKLALDTYHVGHDESVLSRLEAFAPHTAVLQLGDARVAPCG